MNVLGINSLTHDSSVALLINGEIIKAVEEERFSRSKHHPGIEIGGKEPMNAINWILKSSKINLKSIDLIVHVGWPGEEFMKLDLIHKRFRNFAHSLDPHLEKTTFVDHHLAHAASAYYSSGFNESLVFSVDGAGDNISLSVYIGIAGNLDKVEQYTIDQSLGFFYSRAAETLGLGGFGTGEGKMVAFAAMGKPTKEILNLVKFRYGKYCIDENYKKVFSKYKSEPNAWGQKHKDFAASVQRIIENTMVFLCNEMHSKYRISNICLAGGVGLNCRMNYILASLPWMKKIFIQPAANDGGLCIGAAYLGAKKLHGKTLPAFHSYLGPELEPFSKKLVENKYKFSFTFFDKIENVVSNLLCKDEIVAWMQGRLEFGPRALGHRSLLGDPRNIETKNKMNRIKERESWRPVAPAIINSKKRYFNDHFGTEFMTMTVPMNELAQKEIPGAVHMNNTARVQKVINENDIFYKLIKSFEQKTDIPAILNTSLNRKGEPLIQTLEQGLEFLRTTSVRYLAYGNYLIKK